MSDEIHSTSNAAPPAAPNAIVSDFKKLIPTLLITVLTAFGTSWWNSQNAQLEFRNRIEKLEEKAENNAKNIAQNSSVLQQNAIRLAENTIIQNNMLEQLKDMKQEQNEIKSLLRK